MSKPKAPTPPDPKETAAAQTSTNLSTAQGNAILGNVNQVTPYGNLTYTQTGQQFVSDPNGQKYWKSPDGQYQTNAPGMTGGGSTTTKQPIYGATNREGKQQIVGYKDVTTNNGGSIPQGWTQVSGNLIPSYTATQTLSPEQQKIFNEQQAAQLNLGRIANSQSSFLNQYLNKPFTLDGLPQGGNASNLQAPQYQQLGAGPKLQTGIDNAGKIQTSFGGNGAITNTYNTDFSADRQRVEDALMERLNTQIAKDRENNEASLANQGIRLGSTAYGASQDDFSRGVNDARLGAILSAGQEQSRLVGLEADRAAFQNAAQQQGYNQALGRADFANQAQQQQFGQNLTTAGFGNDARQQMYQNDLTRTQGNNALQDQAFNTQLAQFNAANQQRTQAMNEAFAARNQPLNEISALMSGSQLTAPNFVNTNMPTIPTVDYAGLVNENYNQRLGAWQQNNAQTQSLLGGLFGLGSAGIMKWSDRRLKEDIHKVGKTNDGQNIYAYRYKGDPTPQMGLMAQEVEKKRPDAVVTTASGYKAVDYDKALGGLFGLGAKEAA